MYVLLYLHSIPTSIYYNKNELKMHGLFVSIL
jgi:hypothetical protein